MLRDPFDLVGEVLNGQFRVEAVAGAGELSVVYQGRSVAEAPIAVKCLDLPATLDGARVRTLAEGFHLGARLHHRLSHGNPHVAQSIAIGSVLAKSGMIVPYLVREWLEGEPLASELARRRAERRQGRSLEETIALLAPAFDAVVEAQAENEAHLALNPRNLFVVQRGERRALQVLDFGVARAMNEQRALLPEYAAPEQLDPSLGAPGPWSDVYTLAVVTLECLSDRQVVSGRAAALDERRRPTPRSLGVTIPRELEMALSRALSREPDRRQSSVAELWGAVKNAMNPPAAVAGAVPSRRLVMPSSPSVGTIPFGFDPRKPDEPTYVPSPPQVDPDLPPVHAVTTPLAPRVETPALPAVIVAMETPVPTPAPGELPPVPPPSPTFPGIEQSRRVSRARRVWVVALAAVVGLGAGTVLVALFLQHRAGAGAESGRAEMSAMPPAPAPVPAPASSSDSAPGSASSPVPAPAVTLPPLDHFPAGTAKQALDAVSGEVTKCRKGKVWGIATATVTFGNDGAVSHVAISVPLTGTATGACVSDTLSTAHVPPYAGKPGVVAYRFFVSAK